MRKKLVAGILAIALTLGFSITALAGQWKQDVVGWWYDNGNGTYPANQWQWIDNNGDGIAECYYFDQYGYCVFNTTTPDGYQVNSNGVWVVSDQIQRKNVGVNQSSQAQSNQNGSTTDIVTPLMLYDVTPVSKNSSYSSTDSQTNKEHEKWMRVLGFSPSYYDGTANMEYYAGRKYNSFKASVAPEKRSAWDKNGYLYLEIYGDDKLLYRSEEITYKTGIFDVNVDISNCDMINIVCVGRHSRTNPEAFILKDARFE